MTPEERAKEIVAWLADLLKPWTAFYGHDAYFEKHIRQARAEALEEAAKLVEGRRPLRLWRDEDRWCAALLEGIAAAIRKLKEEKNQ